MSETFFSYEDQIANLTENKGLVITDVAAAISMLEDISYYALIGGYKHLFYNPMTRKYKNGAYFEDVCRLYLFDHSLRSLFFSYICVVEQKMRSSISYHFTEAYGVEQAHYLNPANYANTRRNRADISELIRILTFTATRDMKHEYVVYQRNTHHNVPLWVTMKTITLGQTSKMYSLLQPSVKARVSHHFSHVTERELIQHLKVLTDFRNVCAHNERLFCHRNRYEIPNTLLHQKLAIPMNGEQYVCGRRDLFAAVISLRYLLAKKDFLSFKAKLKHRIKTVIRQSPSLSESLLLESMGFPANWDKVGRYKL